MRKILIVLVVVMAAAMLSTPVMAIGPWQATEANDNHFLRLMGGAVVNVRGYGPMGFNAWYIDNAGNWREWRFREVRGNEGLMNTALVCHLNDVNPGFLGGVDNQNRWIYLSGDAVGQPNQINGHGTLYYFLLPLFGQAFASQMAGVEFPNGAFYMYNIVT